MEQHRLSLTTNNSGYRASCSCGKWIETPTRDEATDRHAAHVQRLLGPDAQHEREVERCRNCVGDFRCAEHNQEIRLKEFTLD